MFHVSYPDRQAQPAPGLIAAQLARRVVANPGYCCQSRLKARKPGIHGVVSGASFTKQVGPFQCRLRPRSGSRTGNFLQQAGHQKGVAGINGAHRVVRCRRLAFHQHLAFLLRHLADQPWVDPVPPIRKHRIGGGHLQRRYRAGTQRHGQVGLVFVLIKTKTRDPFACILRPDRLQNADRYHVLGSCQTGAQTHRAVKLAVIVFRLPGLPPGDTRIKEQRRVIDDCGRREAFLQRGRVDERLETGARLAPCLRDMVELVFLVVEATHHRLDGTVARVQRHKRTLDFRQLGNFPSIFDRSGHPDHGTTANLDIWRCLIGKA